jgi:hypothetical protein
VFMSESGVKGKGTRKHLQGQGGGGRALRAGLNGNG